jgi:hypothetical protein
MSPRVPLSRKSRHLVRLDKAGNEHVENQIKSGAFVTKNDYFNWLVTQHRTGHDAPMKELEQAVASTIDRFRKDIRGDIFSARRSAELSNAFLHALVKMMLATFPETDDETRKLAQATAKKRYDRLLINATKEYEEAQDTDEE